MEIKSEISPAVKKLMNRLDEDAEFRYRFWLRPEECLAEFDLTPLERKLLGTRNQDDWFSYIYNGEIRAQQLLNVVTIKVVTVKVIKAVAGAESDTQSYKSL